MEPLVHFLLGICAGFGVGLHIEEKNKKYLSIIITAVIATALDLDHIFPAYQESGIKILHNIFVMVFFPVLLLLSLIVWEMGKGSTRKQRYALLLCVTLPGHMFTDIISGSGVSLYYPFNGYDVTVKDIGLSVNSPILSLQAYQVLLIIWGAMILVANFAESFTYFDVEGRKLSIPKKHGVGTTIKEQNEVSWGSATKLPFSQEGILPRGYMTAEFSPRKLPVANISSDKMSKWIKNPSMMMPLNKYPFDIIKIEQAPPDDLSGEYYSPYFIPPDKIPLNEKPQWDGSTEYIFKFVDDLKEN